MSANNGGFDVTIIGSGPGGYVAAVRAGQLGLRTAIIEKDKNLGGTCLLRGCIPTKALLRTADMLEEVKHAKSIGVMASDVKLDFAQAQKNKGKIVLKGAKGVEFLMKKNKVQVFKGTASIEAPGRITVTAGDGTSQTIESKNTIIATGSVPRSLPNLPIDGNNIITSDEILELTEIPKSLVVLGAGAVGVEFASMFARFGTDTTIIELLPRLLPIEDEDMSAELAKAFKRQGIKVFTSASFQSAAVEDGLVRMTVKTGDEEREFTAEKLLVAVGRRAYTDGLGLEKTRVELERGYIKVDDHMRTAEPGIYAIGDVVPTPWLAHVASAEGILAVETIAGLNPHPINYDRVPSCTYCSPEVASVGLTEAGARERGYDVQVGKFSLPVLAKTQIVGATEGLVKVVSDKRYDEVLGLHIIGPHATEMIVEGGAALQLEATVEEMINMIHAHPTVSEGIHEAFEAAHGMAIHGA
ncbi:MAG TPA: dihydrolipoyl dehydrogenase [Blastocatellia bacterium]|nr:dihydrolipoyl dehydrogenase [Blastocatellia bacterium]